MLCCRAGIPVAISFLFAFSGVILSCITSSSCRFLEAVAYEYSIAGNTDNTAIYQILTFGIFSSEDSNTGLCLSYTLLPPISPEGVNLELVGPAEKAAQSFAVLSPLLGGTVLVLQIIGLFQPYRVCYKSSIVTVAFVGFAFQLFTLALLSSEKCRPDYYFRFSGSDSVAAAGQFDVVCQLEEGAAFSIAGAICFLISGLVLVIFQRGGVGGGSGALLKLNWDEVKQEKYGGSSKTSRNDVHLTTQGPSAQMDFPFSANDQAGANQHNVGEGTTLSSIIGSSSVEKPSPFPNHLQESSQYAEHHSTFGRHTGEPLPFNHADYVEESPEPHRAPEYVGESHSALPSTKSYLQEARLYTHPEETTEEVKVTCNPDGSFTRTTTIYHSDGSQSVNEEISFPARISQVNQSSTPSHEQKVNLSGSGLNSAKEASIDENPGGFITTTTTTTTTTTHDNGLATANENVSFPPSSQNHFRYQQQQQQEVYSSSNEISSTEDVTITENPDGSVTTTTTTTFADGSQTINEEVSFPPPVENHQRPTQPHQQREHIHPMAQNPTPDCMPTIQSTETNELVTITANVDGSMTTTTTITHADGSQTISEKIDYPQPFDDDSVENMNDIAYGRSRDSF